MVLGLVAALGAAVLFGGAAVAQAIAVRHSGLVSWRMVGVSGIYLLGWVLHLVAISRLPLYLAQMAIGASLAVTALIASRVVHEPLERRHWVAIGGMVLGFAMLISAAGPVDPDAGHPRIGTALLMVWVALLVAGTAAWRWRAPRSGLALGLLAGLGYSGAPLATRALEEPGLDLQTILPGVLIPLFGALGFTLQSLALQRTSVTAATAPMVLLETFVPAALGVLVFNDAVRHGLGLVALLGFLVATGGALVLSGAEGRLEHLDEPPEDRPDHPAPQHAP